MLDLSLDGSAERGGGEERELSCCVLFCSIGEWKLERYIQTAEAGRETKEDKIDQK